MIAYFAIGGLIAVVETNLGDNDELQWDVDDVASYALDHGCVRPQFWSASPSDAGTIMVLNNDDTVTLVDPQVAPSSRYPRNQIVMLCEE